MYTRGKVWLFGSLRADLAQVTTADAIIFSLMKLKNIISYQFLFVTLKLG